MRGLTLSCLALTLLSGCYSFSNLGRARTLDQGRVEVWGAPEAIVVATDTGASVRPIGEVGVRYGITDDVEFDARITTLGVTVGPRLQLHRSPDPGSGFDVALAPSLAYTYPERLALELPLVVGLNLGEHQLVLAPRVAYQVRLDVPNVPGPVSFVYVGGALGLALRLTPNLTLMPEVAMNTEVYADRGFSSNVSGGVGLQGSLGLLVEL